MSSGLFVLWFVGLGARSIDSFMTLAECKVAAKQLTATQPQYYDPVFKQYENGRYVCLPEGHHPWKAKGE